MHEPPVLPGLNKDRNDDRDVGRRVAHHRRRRGLTQPLFAARVGRSTAWVSGVERGKYHLDRLPLLIMLADALDIKVSDLLPEATRCSAEEPPRQDDATGLVAALGTFPIVGALYGQPGPATDLDDLEARLDALITLEDTAEHAAVAVALVSVLTMANGVAMGYPHQAGPDQDRSYRLASRAYAMAARALFHLGQSSAAWLASDRSIRAAVFTDDRELVVGGVMRASRLFLADGRYDQAQAAAESVVQGLASAVRSPAATPGELVLAGNAHLMLAVVAANRWNRGTAQIHLAAADDLATRLGDDRRVADAEFGPNEVLIHRVTVAVALQDAGDALEIARRIDTDVLHPVRHARLLLHRARAEILCQEPDRALALLMRADRLNPNQAAHHPLAWKAIEDLGTMAVRIHATGDLHHLQGRVRRTW